jgi:thymidylate synthase (FAD)
MTEVQFSSDLSVQYVQHMGSDAMICRAAKVSAQALEAQDAEESARLIKFLADNRHGTPFEHTAMTFMVTEPIFVTREFHRHRIGWSYNEESGRWRKMEARFYLPPVDRPMTQEVIRESSYKAYDEYEFLLKKGIAKEVARQLLPLNLYTSFFATCNARSLMHFLSLRMHKTALWEIRQIANAAYDIFEQYFPLTAHAFVEAGKVAP